MPDPMPMAENDLLRPATRIADRVDRGAKGVISTSGIVIIASVLAIVVFIGAQGVALLRPDHLEPDGPSVDSRAVFAGTDEYRENAWLVTSDAVLEVRPLGSGGSPERVPLPGLDGAAVVAASASLPVSRVAVGTGDGRVAVYDIRFMAEFQGQRRILTPRVSDRGVVPVAPGSSLRAVAGNRDEDANLRVAALDDAGKVRLGVYLAESSEGKPVDLPEPLSGEHLAMPDGRAVLAVASGDQVHVVDWIDLESPHTAPAFRASFPISAMAFVLGGDSLAIGLASGAVDVISRVAHAGKPATWMTIATFPADGGAVRSLSASSRHKSLLALGDDGTTRLLHLTTRRELARTKVAGATWVHFAPKGDGAMARSDAGVQALRVSSPHPEVSIGTLFRAVWYESYPQPSHVWQSSGGTDDIEPKFGLVPLLLGTLKGTVYAMLFSAPLAVAAALYLSALAPPALRNVVKPSLELMAAIPSVVVGFLAALWLAPIIERNLVALFILPAVTCVVLFVVHALARRIAARRQLDLSGGRELMVVVPCVVLAALASMPMATALESALFGGDVRQWLFDTLGWRYDQRNCVVVGVALGFAVVPIIFTIAEDAFSAVPPSLTSAALALGCTPWQTAVHVVLPAAAPGVFAALMLGFGRALGETMIVLMATGNTPILDLMPFNGMRTMSAAIAVEIPEAPAGGTHYRVLFVVGFLLFVLAFSVNTLADVIATRLRRKFGRI